MGLLHPIPCRGWLCALCTLQWFHCYSRTAAELLLGLLSMPYTPRAACQQISGIRSPPLAPVKPGRWLGHENQPRLGGTGSTRGCSGQAGAALQAQRRARGPLSKQQNPQSAWGTSVLRASGPLPSTDCRWSQGLAALLPIPAPAATASFSTGFTLLQPPGTFLFVLTASLLPTPSGT